MNAPLLPRTSRRAFLRQAGLGLAACAATGLAPRLLARTAGDRPARTLILIQLAGGNDWLNTFVPADDDTYARRRPTLALARPEQIPLQTGLGLHRAAAGLEPLFKDGQLAVVAGLGPTHDVATHHRATELWHTASASEEILGTGWAGRALADVQHRGGAIAAWHGTRLAPRILLAGNLTPRPLATAGQGVGAQLAEIAEQAGGQAATEVFFVSVPGFDTHFDQAAAHAARLAEVSNALAQLQARLARRGVAGRVVTCVFSEFGRTEAENAQAGTDHARLGSALLLGPAIRGGCPPAAAGGTDLRRLTLTLGADWLGAVPAAITPAAFAPLPLLALG